jgi:hypothetical protein
MTEQANGYPVWRHSRGDRFLYFGNDNCWCVGDDEEEDANFDTDQGYIMHESHPGAPPTALGGNWLRGPEWDSDAKIIVSAEPNAMQNAPLVHTRVYPKAAGSTSPKKNTDVAPFVDESVASDDVDPPSPAHPVAPAAASVLILPLPSSVEMQKRFLCEVCRTPFPSYDAAEAHESKCKMTVTCDNFILVRGLFAAGYSTTDVVANFSPLEMKIDEQLDTVLLCVHSKEFALQILPGIQSEIGDLQCCYLNAQQYMEIDICR